MLFLDYYGRSSSSSTCCCCFWFLFRLTKGADTAGLKRPKDGIRRLSDEGESERQHVLDLLLLGIGGGEEEEEKKEREEFASLYIGDGRQEWLELFTFLSPTFSQCF